MVTGPAQRSSRTVCPFVLFIFPHERAAFAVAVLSVRAVALVRVDVCACTHTCIIRARAYPKTLDAFILLALLSICSTIRI